MRWFKDFYCIDFETFFADDYSLRNKDMSTTSYIRDERFKAHCMGIQHSSWPKPKVYQGKDIPAVLAHLDRDAAVLCQHTQFDGLILTHHYDYHPAFWLDTMAMSPLVFGVEVRHSLEEISARFGREGKPRKGALDDVRGVRDLNNEQLRRLAEYNADDVYHTIENYKAMRSAVPDAEMRVIDMTIRMYVEPTIILDAERVAQLLEKEVAKKAEAFAKSPVVVDGKGGQDRLIQQLRDYGVDIPMKNSPTAQKKGEVKWVPALAKGDLEFKALQSHPDERVRDLVEARVRSKSAQIETRSRRVLGYQGLPMPIYLKYWAARTGRWGGGDKVNWQNLPRRGDGAELRRALMAPDGHLLIISDASQIEARLNSWDAGDQRKLDIFADPFGDVYKMTASDLYGIPFEEITDDQRFVGKVFELGGGYGAGAPKMNYMFKLGQFGPPMNVPLEDTAEKLTAWRHVNYLLVRKWKENEQKAKHAFLQQTVVEDGCMTFEGTMGDGFIHAPNGTYLRYQNIQYDSDTRQMSYTAKTGPIKLYGGIITENKIQKLARHCLAHQLLQMDEEMPDARIAGLVHDEVIIVAPARRADEYAARVKAIMSTPPPWATGLPLNAKTEVHSFYNKS